MAKIQVVKELVESMSNKKKQAIIKKAGIRMCDVECMVYDDRKEVICSFVKEQMTPEEKEQALIQVINEWCDCNECKSFYVKEGGIVGYTYDEEHYNNLIYCYVEKKIGDKIDKLLEI